MKKILYATDFSKNAEKAFHFALKTAEKHHAELVMVHVYDIPPVWGHPYITDPGEMSREARKSWQSDLKDLFEQFKSDIKPKFVALENNSAVKGVLQVIYEFKPDLVVVGTKGKSKLKEIFVGSTTKALAKQSPSPVMAIPENAVKKDFKKALYATDFREIDLKALTQLIDLVKPYKGKVKIIHVSTENEYKGNEKMEWFKDLVKENITYKHISYELLLSESIFEKLNDYIKQHDFDLIAMLEKERYGIVEKLFQEDLVSRMEFHTSIPLVSYNEHYLRTKDEKEIKRSDTIEH